MLSDSNDQVKEREVVDRASRLSLTIGLSKDRCKRMAKSY